MAEGEQQEQGETTSEKLTYELANTGFGTAKLDGRKVSIVIPATWDEQDANLCVAHFVRKIGTAEPSLRPSVNPGCFETIKYNTANGALKPKRGKKRPVDPEEDRTKQDCIVSRLRAVMHRYMSLHEDEIQQAILTHYPKSTDELLEAYVNKKGYKEIRHKALEHRRQWQKETIDKGEEHINHVLADKELGPKLMAISELSELIQFFEDIFHLDNLHEILTFTAELIDPRLVAKGTPNVLLLWFYRSYYSNLCAFIYRGMIRPDEGRAVPNAEIGVFNRIKTFLRSEHYDIVTVDSLPYLTTILPESAKRGKKSKNRAAATIETALGPTATFSPGKLSTEFLARYHLTADNIPEGFRSAIVNEQPAPDTGAAPINGAAPITN
ncbi:hypothetical protein BJ508DRAFT_313095 [Ascobolus immersus RN42]|uniref:Uncharacterized protein n=1 Tax=Ascobolus immersus RN42 TaxID=1160509 RepID=A0A3N4HMR1_ASCIM|nr:hypothetical protein BJ508DRAFT_313095 [Ascobolus immersus RN42]